MLYYKPEEWDALEPVAVEYCNEHGLGKALEYINETVCDAWKLLIRYRNDSLSRDMARMRSYEAYGMYNALLIHANECGRDDVWQAIYNWGHYSVFY